MKSNVNFYLYISMFLNIAISIMKIIAGTLLHSKALITDAMHSLSDLTTDFIGLFGNIISYKKPDKEHPFGHHNLEYIISIIIIRSGLKICFNNYSSLLMEDQKDNETSKKIKALIKNNNYFLSILI